ncbi:chaplin [Streptomyces sp. NPDC000229]|uniref:chaplin n=1 Tax=Streptomyces sp. NPDC000229 TaxID=3154247 RepID=UPI003326B45D
MSRIARSAAVIVGTGAVVLSGSGVAMAGASADAAAVGSPGVISGNVIQVPIDIPINVCGNTVNIVGLLNPAFGNKCANIQHHEKDDKKNDHKKDDHKNGYGG